MPFRVLGTGVIERASGPVRGVGRRNGAAGALPRPAVRADARVLGAPAGRAPVLPAPRGRPGAHRAALLPPPLLLPLAAGAGAVRAAALRDRSVLYANV